MLSRMLKKFRRLTRPTPTRQHTPFRRQGRRRVETGDGTVLTRPPQAAEELVPSGVR